MLFPSDHPALADPVLAPWAARAEEVCADGRAVRVLRYLPGRRVATLVRLREGPAVLKVFASPRARGNHRRLHGLARSAASAFVPVPLAVDCSGHVSLVEFVEGQALPEFRGDRLVDAARLAGGALRRLHDSGAQLDREWTPQDEVDQLRRTTGLHTAPRIEAELARQPLPACLELVPSHRDCHPAQAVVVGGGVRWIDLDDAAMAPPGLDVGNFVAHLVGSEASAPVPGCLRAAAARAFLSGYGRQVPDLWSWQRLSFARLAALAETRHHSLHEAEACLELLRAT